jgi:hydroxylaminobenzene mutase
MDRRLLRHGFILIGLALVTGFVIPSAKIPRLALSAHTIGVISGLLLIAVGIVWDRFLLSAGQRSAMYWTWLYSSYANWFAILVGAMLGTGRMTPVASAGAVGHPLAEQVISLILISVGLVSLAAVALSIWGMRGSDSTTSAIA